MLQQIAFLLFRVVNFFIGITPFWMLYIFSDFLFLLIFYVIGYRKKVVFGNIRIAFPEKSEKEVYEIARKFYRFLTDLIVESIKGNTMSKKSLVKRFRIINPEVADYFFDKGQQVMGVTGHYANWEWGGLAMPLQQKHVPVGLYKPLSNKKMDEFLRGTRTKMGAQARAVRKTAAAFAEDYGKPAMFMMVADQCPTKTKRAFCMDFFGKQTPFLHGPEVYAKKHNLPVIYTHIYRVARGHYEVDYHVLVENPADTQEGEITTKYKDYLEEVIRKEPAYWLWSHKRWKRECYQAEKQS